MKPDNKPTPLTTRRNFLRTSTAATAAGAVAGAASFPSLSLAQGIKNKKLKIGLVGCGGRGSGAASQALSADENVELYAVADLFQDKIDRALGALGKSASGKINVPPERQFIGLDGWQKVLNSGIDVVLLATTPAFRPAMFEAAVEKGLHIFCEKPVGIDVPGVNRVLEASRKAKEKGLSIMSGFCWRYNPSRRQAYQRVLDGSMGDVRSIYGTYLTGPVKPLSPDKTKPEPMSDFEWQISHWYNYIWLCGDSFVEQAIHSVDKILWALGDIQPLSAVGVGGREQPNPGGQIFDHFHVTYEFPREIRAFMTSRQQRGAYNENADYITCADGSLIIGRSSDPYTVDKDGNTAWRFRSKDPTDKKNMYQQEHDELFASIRSESAHNDGEWMTNSTLAGIMGRTAAYTGKLVEWDDFINDETSLMPEGLTWESFLDIGPQPVPGQTELQPPIIKP